MAIIRKGILGGFEGKVGNIIGYNLRGQNIIRSVPRKDKRPATVAPKAQKIISER